MEVKHEHYMDMNRLSDWSVEQIDELLDTCLLLKEMEEKGVRLPLLKDVSLAMMFDQQSTRTRVSFETAMTQFGGHAMFLGGSSLHSGSGQEDIAETAAIISSMADAIMIRSKSQRVIDEVVANSTVPVISGMSCNDFRADGFGSQEQHHPTQVIADLITMIERKPQGKKLSDCTFMWLGDGADGFDCVFMDHLSLFPRLGIRVICAGPKKFWPSEDLLEQCRKQAAKDGNGEIICTEDPIEYAPETDFFYTGVVNYHKEGVSEEEAFDVFYPKFQINEELLSHAPKSAWVMHYLPGNRNWEMTDAVWDGPQSALLPLGENRLYAQRGILVYILWPLRRNTSEALENHYQGKVEDLLTPRIHNYDF